jgi:hypothetical protein
MASMKLSWVESKRYVGWTKWIGRTAANNKPRCFYLGKDRTEAELKAVRLTLAYKRLVAAGAAGWTEDAIKAALDSPAAPPAAPVVPPGTISPPPDSLPTQRGLMLYDAFDAYVKYEEGRAPNETTYAFSNGQRIRVRRLKKMMPNKLLAGVGYDDLAALVSKAASRPVSKLTKERISVVTAVDTIKCARAVFDWMDTSERWIAPRRFERIFRINRNSLLTCQERDDHVEGVKTFSVDELVKISEMAWTRWHRLFIWSALNLAMTQFELSSISRRHLKGFDTDQPRIEKCREKTNVFCRWGFIFPEVADGMRWLMDTHNREIVFVGPNGRPPVRFHPKGRSDCVAPWWSRLVKRAGVQPLTFRYLRKTAADMVRKLSDKDTSEAMLSHSNGGVVKVYSNHDWAKLEAALRGLHQQLLPALVVADKKPFLTRRRAK